MKKYYIYKAYNGVEIVDNRPDAEDLLYSMELLEKRYKRYKRNNKNNKKWYKIIANICANICGLV